MVDWQPVDFEDYLESSSNRVHTIRSRWALLVCGLGRHRAIAFAWAGLVHHIRRVRGLQRLWHNLGQHLQYNTSRWVREKTSRFFPPIQVDIQELLQARNLAISSSSSYRRASLRY
eukprot:6492058-Amphidinium_carterae.2